MSSLLARCVALAKNRVPLRQMTAPLANYLDSAMRRKLVWSSTSDRVVVEPGDFLNFSASSTNFLSLNRSYVSVTSCLTSKDLRHGGDVHKKSVEKQLSAKIQQKMEKLKADDDELEQPSASAQSQTSEEEAPKEVPLSQAEKEEAEIEKTRQILINAKASLQ